MYLPRLLGDKQPSDPFFDRRIKHPRGKLLDLSVNCRSAPARCLERLRIRVGTPRTTLAKKALKVVQGLRTCFKSRSKLRGIRPKGNKKTIAQLIDSRRASSVSPAVRLLLRSKYARTFSESTVDQLCSAWKSTVSRSRLATP